MVAGEGEIHEEENAKLGRKKRIKWAKKPKKGVFFNL